MFKCTNCDYKNEQKINFCPLCGSAMTEEAPLPVAEPTPAPKRVRRGPMRIKRIAALILSILGAYYLVLAVPTTLYNIMVAVVQIAAGYAFAGAMSSISLLFACVGSAGALPYIIAALLLARSCIRRGDESSVARLAKKISLGSLIIELFSVGSALVMFLISLLATAASA